MYTVIRIYDNDYNVDLRNKDDVRMVSILLASMYYNGNSEEKESAAWGFCKLIDLYIEKLMRRYYPTYSRHYEDMKNCAFIGVLKALREREYDPVQSMPSTFFHPYIMAEIREFIMSFVNHTTYHFYKADLAIRDVLSENPAADKEEICEKTGLPGRTVDICANIRMLQDISLTCLEDGGIVCPSGEDIEESFCEKDMIARLYAALSELDDNEKKCLILYYGIGMDNHLSAAKIADSFQLDVKEVKKILYHAKRHLKDILAA